MVYDIILSIKIKGQKPHNDTEYALRTQIDCRDLITLKNLNVHLSRNKDFTIENALRHSITRLSNELLKGMKLRGELEKNDET